MSDNDRSQAKPSSPPEHGPDEREQVEQLAQAHAALAAAQDRSYWLDRWGVDLNGLMRRPGARRARTTLRFLRELKRGTVSAERYTQQRLDMLRTSAAEDDMAATAPIHEAGAEQEPAGGASTQA